MGKYVILVFLAALIAWRAWPLIDPHTGTDQCTFGTGSTALHERLRAEADDYLAKDGKARLRGYSMESAQTFADEVSRQLRGFALSRPTPTERWASIHALLRAYGMEFDHNFPRDKEQLEPDFVVLSTRYFVQLPKLNALCLLCYVFPTAAFKFRLENRGDGVYDQVKAGLWITRFNPKASPVYFHKYLRICPEVLK